MITRLVNKDQLSLVIARLMLLYYNNVRALVSFYGSLNLYGKTTVNGMQFRPTSLAPKHGI